MKILYLITLFLLMNTLIITSVTFAAETNNTSDIPRCTPTTWTLCADKDNQELCLYNYNIWKRHIMKEDMTEEYFNNHLCFEIISADRGFFYILYAVKIDWAVIQTHDQFSLRKIGTSNDEILSDLVPIKPIDKLHFLTKDDAVNAIRHSADNETIHFQRSDFYVPGRIPRKDGYPYLFGFGTVDRKINKCIDGYTNRFFRRISG